MALVVLLHKQPKHGVVVRCRFGVAVPVEEQETAVTVHDDSLCALAVCKHTLQCFIDFLAHGDLPDTTFRFRLLNVVARFLAPKKLVVYCDCSALKVKVGVGQPAKLGNPQPLSKSLAAPTSRSITISS